MHTIIYCSRHYSIVAPTTFRPSSTYNVTATCYNVTQDVQLTLRLLATNRTLVEKQALLKKGRFLLILRKYYY